jgi:hypothetical protein
MVNFVLWFYVATVVFSYCVRLDYALVNVDPCVWAGLHHASQFPGSP